MNAFFYEKPLASLLLQASTRLEGDPSELPQCKLQHPLSLIAGLPTRPLLPTKPQPTRPLPTRPLPMKLQPTRPQPAPSRFHSTKRLGSQWRQRTTRPPLTLLLLPQPVLLLRAFPSHSALARSTHLKCFERKGKCFLTGELLLGNWPGRR